MCIHCFPNCLCTDPTFFSGYFISRCLCPVFLKPSYHIRSQLVSPLKCLSPHLWFLLFTMPFTSFLNLFCPLIIYIHNIAFYTLSTTHVFWSRHSHLIILSGATFSVLWTIADKLFLVLPRNSTWTKIKQIIFKISIKLARPAAGNIQVLNRHPGKKSCYWHFFISMSLRLLVYSIKDTCVLSNIVNVF